MIDKPANALVVEARVELGSGRSAVSTAARVREFLALRDISAEYAGRRKMLGTSAPPLYKLLNGQPVAHATMVSINNALDAHQRKGPPKIPPKVEPVTRLVDGVRVQELPHTFPPITGANRAPAPAAPPRHARTP